MKKLILAEKPSVARDIARVLNCTKKGNGYLEGNHYVITWALGHLVTLADPEIYDTRYQKWNIEDLPMIPTKLELIVIKQTSKQYNIVKSQMVRTDIDEIIIATDAGREGELVARWIIEKAKIKKNIKRLWISSVTDKAIKEGFTKLKNGKEYENLYASAVARAQADWLVGMNATRALTCKFNAQLSCGRVQTPTIATIAKREQEIKEFKPKTYYSIEAMSNQLKLTWQELKTKDYKTFDKTQADKVAKLIINKKGIVQEITKTYKKVYSPKLYDLTELQRDANKRFGFSAKETLNIMQKLYETHKVLTYPRTDSRYITTDIVGTLKERLKTLAGSTYGKYTRNILSFPIKALNNFVDDSKVTDHHAIIPTEQAFMLNSLSSNEFKIYDLVVKRFLSVLSPPFEYEQTIIKAMIENEMFIAKGKIVKEQGFKAIFQDITDEDTEDGISEQILPAINKGDEVNITSVKQLEGKTKPPSLYNEATLLSAMEKGNLGTVATRADIIEKIFNCFYVEKAGKDIITTKKGRQLLELVPNDLKTPELTANWEDKLLKIAKGSLKKEIFIRDIENYTKDLVKKIKYSTGSFKHDNITNKKCPECGKLLLSVSNKKGKLLVCQDRECSYKKNIAITTNARCPLCHKKLELHGEGDNQVFSCVCGHREKMSSFKQRKQDSGGNMSKKEVSKYLDKQNKSNDEPLNNAFALAFAKIDLNSKK